MMPKVEMWLCTNLLKCQVSSRSKRFMYYQTSPILSISRGGTLLIVTILGASSTSPAPSPACLRFLISASSSALSRSVLTPDISVITHHIIQQPEINKEFSAREFQSIAGPTYSITIWKIIDKISLGTHISRLSCDLTLPGTGFKSVIRSIRQPRSDENPSQTFEADSFSPIPWMLSAGILATFVLLFVARCRVFIRVERDKPVGKSRQW